MNYTFCRLKKRLAYIRDWSETEMKVGFIGAGKAGFSLGKYFKEKGLSVSGYYSIPEKDAI